MDIGIDLLQESKELLVPMAWLTPGDDLAIGDVESSKQRRCAVPLIIMSEAISIAEAHWQYRLRALQRLNLTILIDTEDHGVFGRVEI